jgi:hypothetical protein
MTADELAAKLLPCQCEHCKMMRTGGQQLLDKCLSNPDGIYSRHARGEEGYKP